MRQWLKPVFISSFCLGIIVAAFTMYTAWEHNPQCSIHCTEEGVSWGYLFLIGTSWAIPTTLICFLLFGLFPLFIKKVIRR